MSPAPTSLAEVVHSSLRGEPAKIVPCTVRIVPADATEFHLNFPSGTSTTLASDHGCCLVNRGSGMGAGVIYRSGGHGGRRAQDIE